MRLIYISLFLLVISQPAAAAPLTVYAAASTVTAMKPIEKLWKETHNRSLRIVYGSSGALARQISLGAPAHVYFSANPRWIDYLANQKAIRPESRKTIFANRLVLIGPTAAKRHTVTDLSVDLPRLLGRNGRLAIGDPRHVPAGRYARQALIASGIWKTVAPRSARTRNVRLALALVQRGEAPIGIVYRSDARNDKLVRILHKLPEHLHATIIYEAVATTTRHPKAVAFLSFLTSPVAIRAYRDAGFTVPE